MAQVDSNTESLAPKFMLLTKIKYIKPQWSMSEERSKGSWKGRKHAEVLCQIQKRFFWAQRRGVSSTGLDSAPCEHMGRTPKEQLHGYIPECEAERQREATEPPTRSGHCDRKRKQISVTRVE